MPSAAVSTAITDLSAAYTLALADRDVSTTPSQRLIASGCAAALARALRKVRALT